MRSYKLLDIPAPGWLLWLRGDFMGTLEKFSLTWLCVLSCRYAIIVKGHGDLKNTFNLDYKLERKKLVNSLQLKILIEKQIALKTILMCVM